MPSVYYENTTHVIFVKGGGNVTGELSHSYTMLPRWGKVTICFGKVTRVDHFDPSVWFPSGKCQKTNHR